MDAVQRMVNRLEAGADSFACGGYLARLDGLHRAGIYNTLLFERLKRKYDDVSKVYYDLGQNWNQTFYTMLFRFLGAPANREAFDELSQRATYAIAVRYMTTGNPTDRQMKLEALLIGASGLLNLYRDDDYTRALKSEYRFIAEKFGIETMRTSAWKVRGIYPHNHPVLRLAQTAAFLAKGSFAMENLLACSKPKDVEELFGAEVSNYWLNHFVPSSQSSNVVKRIGSAKSDILAINVVVILQYAYGSYTTKYELCDRARNLLESVRPENNFKVRRWSDNGVIPKSAFDTQALIQLGDEYCGKRRCRECPIGKRIIKSVERSCNIE